MIQPYDIMFYRENSLKPPNRGIYNYNQMKPLVYIINCPPFWLKTPALGLICLENYLKKNKADVKVVDLNSKLFKKLKLPANRWLSLDQAFENSLFSLVEEKYPHFLNSLYKRLEKADFIGFSVFKRNWPFVSALAEKIQRKLPGKKIIFGGPHTLFLERENKLDKNSFWVIGEGEMPLLEIARGSKQKLFRFKEIAELDDLSFLDFDSLGLYSNCIPVLSSRGCPYTCGFCSEKLLSKKFRQHSPLYTAQEIKYLVNKYKINSFVFCDSLINYSTKWLEDFCRLIIKSKLKIKWEAQARVDKRLTPELAALMKKSGCYNLFIGLESGSDKTLKTINKGFDTTDALAFFNSLKKGGLHFEVSMIFGHPKETSKDFEQSLKFIVENKNIIPKIAQANPFVDYLGDFPDTAFPAKEAEQRVDRFIKTIQEHNIRYTKSFINNLVY